MIQADDIRARLLAESEGDINMALDHAAGTIAVLADSVSAGMMRAPPLAKAPFPRKPVLNAIVIEDEDPRAINDAR